MIRATSMQVDIYKEYIRSHAEAVEDVWYRILLPSMHLDEPKLLTMDLIKEMSERLIHHDEDKITNPEILHPYARYFANPLICPKHSDDYRKAWLLHQNNSPHHWQYWVLMNDEVDPKIVATKMDLASIIEMLCDWQAASWHYGNTAHWWYETQKEHMILHPKTQRMVERLLCYLD